MSIEGDDPGTEHDVWDQWYAGSPLYPVLTWEWRGGPVQKKADRNGKEYCVSQMNNTEWRWGIVNISGMMPTTLYGPFSSWEIAAADCEAKNVD